MIATTTPGQGNGPRAIADLVDRYLRALTTADFDDYPFAERVVFRGPRMGPVQGADSVRAVLDQVAGLFRRFSVVEHGRVIGGDEAVLLVEVVLPDGRGFTIADHLRFSAGELVLLRPYFDAGLLEELGFAPAVADLGPDARL